MEVRFYDKVEDSLLKFAVIISRTDDRWVLCKHRERETLEVPGGHRELGESIEEAARRELYEETGAIEYEMKPVCVYSVVREASEQTDEPEESFGMLFFAKIRAFEDALHSEIEKILLLEELPDNWTYPQIQPKLLEEADRRGFLTF